MISEGIIRAMHDLFYPVSVEGGSLAVFLPRLCFFHFFAPCFEIMVKVPLPQWWPLSGTPHTVHWAEVSPGYSYLWEFPQFKHTRKSTRMPQCDRDPSVFCPCDETATFTLKLGESHTPRWGWMFLVWPWNYRNPLFSATEKCYVTSHLSVSMKV